MASINKFKHQLEEGKAVTLKGYSLGEIQPKFRIVKKGLRLSFLSTTRVEPCPDFTGSIHGFQFRPFNSIVGLKNEEDGQFGTCLPFAFTTIKSILYNKQLHVTTP